MRRRKPDSMEIQQMKAHAREEKARRQVSIFYSFEDCRKERQLCIQNPNN
jgi:hypothetical protein